MATVTMDLAEVDQLRDDLKAAQALATQMEINQRSAVIKCTEQIRGFEDQWDYRAILRHGSPTRKSVPTIKEVVSYINMDDLVEPLERKLEQKYKERILELKSWNAAAKNDIERLTKELNDLKKVKKENNERDLLKIQIKELKDAASDQEKIWKERFRMINAELNHEITRTWWQKLFNLNKYESKHHPQPEEGRQAETPDSPGNGARV